MHMGSFFAQCILLLNYELIWLCDFVLLKNMYNYF